MKKARKTIALISFMALIFICIIALGNKVLAAEQVYGALTVTCDSPKAVNVAQEVQTVVKENVQNMTGVPVARVNVIVSGVVFE